MRGVRRSQTHEHNSPPVNQKGGAYYQGRGVAVDDGGIITFEKFFDCVREAVGKTEVELESDGRKLKSVEIGLKTCRDLFRKTHKLGGRVIFIGNGGSAAIASHMAVDYTKNGGIRAIALNDVPTLTCLANDFGYDNVFSKQLEYQSTDADAVVVISSSGRSPNIFNAVQKAKEMGATTVTFSGMDPNNRLRQQGNVNLWVPANDYGIVELAHLALLHAIVSVP
jgi:D-sedoheptulose 7-phosphate isomerase